MKFFTSGSCKVKSSHAGTFFKSIISNLVEPSSRAGLNDGPVNGVVLKLDSIFPLCLILTPAGHHCSQEEQGTYQPPHSLHFWKRKTLNLLIFFPTLRDFGVDILRYMQVTHIYCTMQNAMFCMASLNFCGHEIWWPTLYNPLSIQFSAIQLNTAISLMFQHLHMFEWSVYSFSLYFVSLFHSNWHLYEDKTKRPGAFREIWIQFAKLIFSDSWPSKLLPFIRRLFFALECCLYLGMLSHLHSYCTAWAFTHVLQWNRQMCSNSTCTCHKSLIPNYHKLDYWR